MKQFNLVDQWRAEINSTTAHTTKVLQDYPFFKKTNGLVTIKIVETSVCIMEGMCWVGRRHIRRMCLDITLNIRVYMGPTFLRLMGKLDSDIVGNYFCAGLY